jgi:hypothetical protein
MSHKAGAMGRSWHDGKTDLRERAVNLGLNFDEQWRRALEINPKFIFVTGWNEWIAGRYTQWSRYTDQDCYYPGGLFVDQYIQEYSRDCEPVRGGHETIIIISWRAGSGGSRFAHRRHGPGGLEWMVPSRIEIHQPEFRDTMRHTPSRP